MRIMVPLSDKIHIPDLVDAGADEFYFGFCDKKWDRRFGIFSEINRMSSFGSRANFSISEVAELIDSIHRYHKQAFVTLNSASYSKAEIPFICGYVEMLCEKSVDGIIVGDIYILNEVLKRGGNPVLSTMAGIYNSLQLDFYADMGAKRVILPRDISINSMKNIIKTHPNIDFEVFLMRNGCKYSDSQCSMYHGRAFGSMCSCIDKLENIPIYTSTVSEVYKNEIKNRNDAYRKKYHKEACGICYLKQFYDMGVSTVKIVGRNDNVSAVIDDVKRVKDYIDIIKNNDEFYVKKTLDCKKQYNCYY